MAGEKPAKRGIELAIQRIILGSRWLQAPLYLGLVAVLAIVVGKFPFKIWELVMRALNGEEADIVLGVLSLVDLILIANLVVMVIISGYENFVSHIDTEGITDKLYVLMAMHLTFVLSALMLTYIDRLAATKKIDSGH